MLNVEQLQKDPTSSLERNVQSTLRKIKQKLPADFMLSPIRQDHHQESFMVQPRYIHYQ